MGGASRREGGVEDVARHSRMSKHEKEDKKFKTRDRKQNEYVKTAHK